MRNDLKVLWPYVLACFSFVFMIIWSISIYFVGAGIIGFMFPKLGMNTEVFIYSLGANIGSFIIFVICAVFAKQGFENDRFTNLRDWKSRP